MSYQDVQDQWKTNYPLRRYKISVIMSLDPKYSSLLFPLTYTHNDNWANDLIKEGWELMIPPKVCADHLKHNKRTEELEKERILREF